jgi:hypothetical protein
VEVPTNFKVGFSRAVRAAPSSPLLARRRWGQMVGRVYIIKALSSHSVDGYEQVRWSFGFVADRNSGGHHKEKLYAPEWSTSS